MPVSKEEAIKKARELGWEPPEKGLVSSEKYKDRYYVLPLGIADLKAKQGYSRCRDDGGQAGICAAAAHKIQEEERTSRNDIVKITKLRLAANAVQDDRLFPVTLKILRSGVNENNWNYQNINEYAKTFVGQPILAAFINGKIDAWKSGHNYTEKPENGQTVCDFTGADSERIVGIINQSEDSVWVVRENGEDWIYANGVIFAFYAKPVVDILKVSVMSVSAETDVTEETLDLNGSTLNFFVWRAYGTTILGKYVKPAVPGANIRAASAMTLSDIDELTNAYEQFKAASAQSPREEENKPQNLQNNIGNDARDNLTFSNTENQSIQGGKTR